VSPGMMRGNVDPTKVTRGICTGQAHPNRTVIAVWMPDKSQFICAGDPAQGLDPCGHTVIVSVRAWVRGGGRK
jgi:hypothetical protein